MHLFKFTGDIQQLRCSWSCSCRSSCSSHQLFFDSSLVWQQIGAHSSAASATWLNLICSCACPFLLIVLDPLQCQTVQKHVQPTKIWILPQKCLIHNSYCCCLSCWYRTHMTYCNFLGTYFTSLFCDLLAQETSGGSLHMLQVHSLLQWSTFYAALW